MKTIPGNQRYLKELNLSQVLNLFRENKYLSRIELSRKTQLDAKTITNVVNALFEKGLVKSRGFSRSKGGRPREKLELNPDYGYSIGIDLGASHLNGIITDFQVSILSRHELEIRYGESRDDDPNLAGLRMIGGNIDAGTLDVIVHVLTTERADQS